MVSDSMVSGEATKSRATKIHRIHDYLVGFAGDMGHWQRLLYCGSWPKRPSVKALVALSNEYCDLLFNHVDVLVCTATKVYEIDGGSVAEVAVGVIGDGEPVARGYLEARPGDLKGAVEAACKHSVSCSGPLGWVKL
jgi:hypothetical protein